MSQPTQCATLGWRGGAALPLRTPSFWRPCRGRGWGPRPILPAGAPMTGRRSAVVRARVLPSEHAAWKAKAAAAGVSPSDMLRQAMARTRTWTARAAAVERERTRQVARIGNNLNQIARWANTHAETAEAVEVIAHLVAIERAIAQLAPFRRRAAGCTLGSSPAARARPRAAADYLLGERDAAGNLRAGIEVRRGDPDVVAAVADTLDVRAQVHVRRDRVGDRGPADRRTESKPLSTSSRKQPGRDWSRTAMSGRRSSTASGAAGCTCTS